jgi:hypothetical protein
MRIDIKCLSIFSSRLKNKQNITRKNTHLRMKYPTSLILCYIKILDARHVSWSEVFTRFLEN